MNFNNDFNQNIINNQHTEMKKYQTNNDYEFKF